MDSRARLETICGETMSRSDLSLALARPLAWSGLAQLLLCMAIVEPSDDREVSGRIVRKCRVSVREPTVSLPRTLDAQLNARAPPVTV